MPKERIEQQEKVLLSIVIPTYNRSTLLRENLKRLLEYIKIERDDEHKIKVVVIDNASEDMQGYSIIEDMCKREGQRYYRGIQNTGPTGNFSRSYIASEGAEYLWILSDDDVVSAKGWRLAIRILSGNNPPDILAFNKQLEREIYEGQIKDWIKYCATRDIRMITDNTLISSVIFKRSLFNLEALWRHEGKWFPVAYAVFGEAIPRNSRIMTLPAANLLWESGNTAQERSKQIRDMSINRLNMEFQTACLLYINFCITLSGLEAMGEEEYVCHIAGIYKISPSIIRGGMNEIKDILA